MTEHTDETLERHRTAAGTVAVVSDVHGNLPAFEAVTADVERCEVDEVWCLGDLVGYGAHPDECVARAAEFCDACLVGNHDLVVLDRLDIAAFSSGAAAAAAWTRERIGAEATRFLEGLEPADDSGGVGLYHGSPRDPVWEYVLSTAAAGASMSLMEPRVGVIGHSHVALSFSRGDGAPVTGDLAPAGTTVDLAEGNWLLNPGAVGQPRDGDPRAAWLLLDLNDWSAAWRRVEYPIDQAADAIREAGLPVALADRLYYGQ